MKKNKKIVQILAALITASTILMPVNAAELDAQASPEADAVEDALEGEVVMNGFDLGDPLDGLDISKNIAEIVEEKEPVLLSELYTKEYSMLNTLGILGEDKEAKTNVTRAEFAEIITLTAGLPTGGNATFSDVSSETPKAEYIKAAAQSKLLMGFNDGTFRPDESLTYTQAVTSILRMAGYDRMAEAKGGYPQGYYAIASEKRLSDGFGADMPLTYGNLASLMYKAMTLEVISMESNDLGGISLVQSDMTVIEKFFGLVKGKGTVSAGEYISVKGRNRTTKGNVVISAADGDWLFDAGKSGIEEYVGYNVEYFYNKDDEIVIFITDTRKTEEIAIKEESFVSVDEALTQVDYMEEGSERTKKIKLDAKADFVYNGESCYEVTKEDFEKADYFRFVDNNADGRFDIIYLTVYDMYLVDSYSIKNKIIQDKREGIYFEINEDENDVRYYKSGYETDITSITEWDVLNVTISRGAEKKLIIIDIQSDIIAGELEGVDNNDRKVKIGGETFYVSKKVNMSEFKFGDNVAFGLNKYGAAAALLKLSSNQKKYAYILKGYTDSTQDMDRVELKVMNSVGNIIRLPLAEKFYINDEKGSWESLCAMVAKDYTPESGADGFTAVHQLMSYTVDGEGNAKRIYFANEAKGAIEPSNANSLVLNKTISGLRFRKNGNTINAEYMFENETPIFLIITDADGKIIEEQCGVYTRSSLNKMVEGSRPTVSIYDAGENRIAKVIVMNMAMTSIPSYFDVSGRQGILVTNVTEGIVDDQVVRMVEGYQNGGKVVLYEDEFYDFSDWKRGDMWITTANLKYQTIGATKLFELFPAEGTKTMNPNMPFSSTFKGVRNLTAPDGEINDFTETHTGVYGTLKEVMKIGNTINLKVAVEGTDLVLLYGVSGTAITVYHTKSDKFEPISIENLSVGMGSGKVFLYTRYGLCRDIVVID